MRNFNATQLAIITQNAEISWLMTFVTTGATTYRWSLKEKIYGGNTYTARIISDSFNGFGMNFGSTGIGIAAPNDFTMSAINEYGAADEILDPSDFDDANLSINLVMRGISGVEASIAEWDFKVKLAVPDKQTIRFYITNFLAKKLKGQYPKTKFVKELEASTDLAVNDNLCVPVPFGTVYCPLRSVYIEADNMRYYVLGSNAYSYNISKVHSPTEWHFNAEWVAASYTFSTYTKALDGDNMTVLKAVIADSDEDGTADAQGLWLNGDKFLDPAVQFYRSDTRNIGGTVSGTHTGANNVAILTDSSKTWIADELIGFFIVNITDGSYGIITDNTNNTATVSLTGGTGNDFDTNDTYRIGGPASILKYIFSDIGIEDIDNVTFAEAEKAYATWGLQWQGALFSKEANEVIIGKLLDMCFSRILVRDSLVLSPFSKTSVKTITSAMITSSEPDSNGYRESSFRIEPIFDDSENDSGYVLFQEVDKPQDSFHRLKVAYYAASTFENISGDEIFAGWIQNNQNAQRLGQRIGQRKYRKKYKVSFSTTSECIGIEPGDAITLSGMLYGGTVSAVVESIDINKDCSILIDAVIYKEALLDFLDTTPDDTVYVDNDDSMAIWQMASTGPDNTVSSGNRQNTTYGRIRIGTGNEFIILDNTDPSIKLYESTILRASIGKIGAGNYGIAFYDSIGQETIAIDATRKVIKEMQYEIYTSGIIQTNADIANNGGWAVGPTQQIAYNSNGDKRFQVVFSGADQGDFYSGGYDDGLCGLKIDMSEEQAWFRGDLAIESIPGFPDNHYCFLDVPMTEAYGTILHDESRLRVNGTMSGPVWTTGGPLGSHLSFTAASSHYVDFGDNGNWDYVAAGYDMSWSFWFYVTAAPAGLQVLASKGNTTLGWYIDIESNGTVGLSIWKDLALTRGATSAAITYNQWNHIAFVYDFAAANAGTIYVYLNGELNNTVTSINTLVDASAHNLYFGKMGGSTNYFNGRLSGFKFFHYSALTASNIKALYKYPQGIRGGQVTARSVYVGIPSGSAPGTKIDDTGIWAYGAAGAQLFGFCTIASGTVTWNSQSLSAGHWVLGDYNAASGMLYNGNFTVKVSASDAITMTGGSFSVTAGSVSISSTGTFSCTGSSFTVNATTCSFTISRGSFSVTAGSVSISSTGTFSCTGSSFTVNATTCSFTMAGGTFSITAGTAEILTTSGLTIGGDSKLTINSTQGIIFGSDAYIALSTGIMNFSAQSAGRILIIGYTYPWYSANINVATTFTVSVSDVEKFIVGSLVTSYLNIKPSSSSLTLGTGTGANEYWGHVYADHYYWNELTEWDDYDDLALLKEIKPLKENGLNVYDSKGSILTDMSTVPDMLTNRPTLHEEINRNNETKFNRQDIEDVIKGKKTIDIKGKIIDSKEIKKMIFMEVGPTIGLLKGATVKIDSIVSSMKDEIALLKNEIETIKTHK